MSSFFFRSVGYFFPRCSFSLCLKDIKTLSDLESILIAESLIYEEKLGRIKFKIMYPGGWWKEFLMLEAREHSRGVELEVTLWTQKKMLISFLLFYYLMLVFGETTINVPIVVLPIILWGFNIVLSFAITIPRKYSVVKFLSERNIS